MVSAELKKHNDILAACQKTIGYTFKKPEFLLAALTHSSSANSRAASNERMEFLGDSVLGLVTCEQLYEMYPDYQEGDLTKLKSVIVSRKTCATFSRKLNLGSFLFVGKGGFGRGDELPENVDADLFEALVAAIFLDAGWFVAREFVLKQIRPVIEKCADEAVNANAKASLQMIAQKEFGNTPKYYVIDEQGPDHDKCFKIAADVNGHRFPPAWGRNKKEAELKSALNAMAIINGEKEVPYPC